MEVSDQPLIPGRQYELSLSQTGRLRMKSLEVYLICEEQARFRQGTNSRTERHRVFERAAYRCKDFQIRQDVPFQARFPIELPAGAMHSFKSEHNEINWSLVVHGKAAGWPEFRRSFPLIVYPSAAPKREESMNSPRIRIRFDGNGRTDGPGEILSGEYWLDSMPDDGVRTIEVSVLWYTEGKGDEDLGVHDFRRVAIEENGDGRVPRPGLDCPGRFSTTLPNSPLTYCGVILRVRWCVRVARFARPGQGNR